MNRFETTDPLPRELDYRSSDGFEIWLLWSKSNDRVFVLVHETSSETSFELDVAPADALDAFNHPYAYAASRRRGTTVRHRRDTLVPGV